MGKRFKTLSVDKFRTFKVCNECKGELKRYKNRRGKLSHSRLQCSTCTSGGKPKFVDRNRNAATNILLEGESPERPKARD